MGMYLLFSLFSIDRTQQISGTHRHNYLTFGGAKSTKLEILR